MLSTEIILGALAVLLLGALVLYYQCTGTRRFETLISFCGVALVASGIAMFRDGVEGSRSILWGLPSDTALASVQQSAGSVTDAPSFRTGVTRE